MACFLIVITTLVTVCVFIYCITFTLVARSNARALRTRCRSLQEESAQERHIQARVDQALAQQHVEHHVREMLASLHRLGQVMRGSQQHDAAILARFHHLEPVRVAYDRTVHTLYAMALDRRVTSGDLVCIEADIQHLWNQSLELAAPTSLGESSLSFVLVASLP